MELDKEYPIEETEPIGAYTLAVSGVDIRYYIFDPKQTALRCVTIWGGEDSSHQTECYVKGR